MNQEYRVPKGYFGVATSPLVDGNLLLLNVGGPGAGIVALSTTDGSEVWRATSDEASYASPVLANVGGKKLAAFFTRLGIVLLEPATGKVVFSKRWRARINASVNAATPVVTGDRLFFTSSYNVGGIALKAKGMILKRSGRGTIPCQATMELRSLPMAFFMVSTAARRRAPGCAAWSWTPAKCAGPRKDLAAAP